MRPLAATPVARPGREHAAADETASTFRRRARLVLILGALSAFGPLSIDMYLPALPDLRRDFGTGASQVQLTLSGCLIGLAVGQLLAGPASDALGRRRPLLIGLAAYALASLLCAVAPSVAASRRNRDRRTSSCSVEVV